jgi:hypothetical protein
VRNKATLAAEALFDSEACGGDRSLIWAVIEQVEQVPMSVLEGLVRLCRDAGLGSQGR